MPVNFNRELLVAKNDRESLLKFARDVVILKVIRTVGVAGLVYTQHNP